MTDKEISSYTGSSTLRAEVVIEIDPNVKLGEVRCSPPLVQPARARS